MPNRAQVLTGLLFYPYVGGIHPVRILVFDNYQRCPVPVSVKSDQCAGARLENQTQDHFSGFLLRGADLYWDITLCLHVAIKMHLQPLLMKLRNFTIFIYHLYSYFNRLKADSHCNDNEINNNQDAKRPHSIGWIDPCRIRTRSLNHGMRSLCYVIVIFFVIAEVWLGLK